MKTKTNKTALIPKLRFPEFKNTGVWEVKKLGDMLIKNTRKNKDNKYHLIESVSNKYGFVKQDDFFDKRVASKDTRNYYVIDKGTFAYNPSRIDVGSLAYKDEGNVSIISPLYVSFKVNNDFIIDKYLLFWFKTEDFAFQRQLFTEGGVRNTLSFENLKKIKLPIPTLPEQQKIADFLSNLDEWLAAEEEKLTLLETYKKGLLQNLFPAEGETVPKLRFPEFQNSGAWEETFLSQVADYENGKAHEREIEDIGNFIVVNSKFISSDGEEKKYTNKALCPAQKGDILMVLSDVPNGKAIAKCFLVEENNRYTVNQRICRIIPQSLNSKILYYLLNRNPYFLAFDDGVKQTNLRKEDVLNCPLLIPKNPKEQQKIADCLSALDEQIEAQRQKVELLKQHKKGLLQNLFPKFEF
ncbi:MAG: hypothetical protein AA908_09715 [Chlorobi bacterium NICIL-2]|nr:MAG: hypothetical protein AA908_09715 [Chlorobi bacterium NICIL-2]